MSHKRAQIFLPVPPQQYGASLGLKLSEASELFDLIYVGKGNPEGNVRGPVGSIFLRTDGGANTTLYVKESGTGKTGWVAK